MWDSQDFTVVQNYSRIARPLHNLLNNQTSNSRKPSKSNTQFVWSPEAQCAFDCLKETLVLAYADYSLPFEVHTDASSTALGAILY